MVLMILESVHSAQINSEMEQRFERRNHNDAERGLLFKQAEFFKTFGNYINGLIGILHLFPASDDQFPRAKEEGNNLWLVKSIHQPGELLWFILNILETTVRWQSRSN